jgi:hypothetical protein
MVFTDGGRQVRRGESGEGGHRGQKHRRKYGGADPEGNTNMKMDMT